MRLVPALLMCILALGTTASAQSKGDWLVGFGAVTINPKSQPSNTSAGRISVGDNIRPTITAEYFIWDNIGIKAIAGLPFKHSLYLEGAGKIGTTKHLPPVVTMHYYFTNSSRATPFLGAGFNYTHFFDIKTEGALAGAKLDLSDSFGYALHAGLMYNITERSALRVDMRYIDLDTKPKVDGQKIGKVDVNPMVFGASWLLRL